MTTYPLLTLAPTVGPNGITAPDYNDILLSLQASYQAIYGSDADLDPDTQDGQWLAIRAAAQNDTNNAIIATYNNQSPATAQGAGLSSVVKINGIARLIPTNSTAPITLIGQAGTTITNGLVGDNLNLGTQWALPTTVNIPVGGSIEVTAVCTTAGAVTAAVNTLTVLLTPTFGWQSANNTAAAAVGQPVETDAELRARQTSSTALPSETAIAGIVGDIENLPGVIQVTYDDNDTNSTDGNGVPAHSVSVVVLGGVLQNIVNIIGAQKTIGGGTYGNTSGTYTDPVTGVANTINFSIPSQLTILVTLQIDPLAGYTTAVGVEIQNSIAAYISQLGNGQNVLLTRLYQSALLQWPGYVPANIADAFTYEIVNGSLLIAISPGSPGSSDLTIAYNQRAICAATNVTVNVV